MGCPTMPAAQCEDQRSDWYAWITTPSLLSDSSTYLAGTPPSGGPGFFELYPHDLDLAASALHSNSLRLSIEWSRIYPDSSGVPSADGVAYYHSIFAAMKARGLTPLVTLNHYTLPSWLHDAVGCHSDLTHCSPRGWLEPTAVDQAAKYAGYVAGEFPEVQLWATLNEPFTAIVLAGYLLPSASRTNPPGVTLQWDAAKQVYLALIHAHARMYDAVKAAAPNAQVGIVYNLQAVSPADPSRPLDVSAATNVSYLMNSMFLNAVARGDLDSNFDGNVTHESDLAGRMDFLGINYYDRVVAQGLSESLFPDQSPYLTFNPFTLQLNSDATGFSEVLELARGYSKPIYITETGIGDADDTGAGAAWIQSTTQQSLKALQGGIDIRGYFYWTLMDNYEWNHGMTMKFGLYGVDSNDTQKIRTPRPNAIAAFAKVAQSRNP
jgi:beta-galactosidase